MSGDRTGNTSARSGNLLFGQSTEGGPHLGSSTAAELVGKRGKRGGEIGAPPSFLDKVSSILDEPKFAERITWNQEGDGIVIREMDKFASEVLPLYFKHSNYQSFVRQLNIYGFHKTSHNDQSCEFKQPYFRRDQRHLMGLIRRKGHGSSVSTKQQREHHHVHEASNGMKEIVDRIYGEMRRLCNRVSQLEAEMGLINERHDALKLENQALWGLVLEEGSESFTRRATEALEKLPNEMKEMIFTPRQGDHDRCARDLSSWRPSPLATQSEPSPPMAPPPPSPTPLILCGHTNTNIETTTTNSSSVSSNDFGMLPSSSHFPSFTITGQTTSIASSYPPAGGGSSSSSSDVSGIRGAFSVGRVDITGGAGPQQQQQQQREVAEIEGRGVSVVRSSERFNGIGGGEENIAVAGNAALAHPGGSASSSFSDTQHASSLSARELGWHSDIEVSTVNCTSPTRQGEAIRGQNTDGENETRSQYAVGPPTAMTSPESILSAEGEFETSEAMNGHDSNGWESVAAIASGERRSMETD